MDLIQEGDAVNKTNQDIQIDEKPVKSNLHIV